MIQRDELISNGLETIKEKISKMGKPDPNYRFKTNCRFGEKNIKTLGTQQLVECVETVKLKEYASLLVEEELKKHQDPLLEGLELNNELYGFPTKDWLEDIIYLLKKSRYIDQTKELEKKARDLEAYYSKDKQDDIAVNAILSSL